MSSSGIPADHHFKIILTGLGDELPGKSHWMYRLLSGSNYGDTFRLEPDYPERFQITLVYRYGPMYQNFLRVVFLVEVASSTEQDDIDAVLSMYLLKDTALSQEKIDPVLRKDVPHLIVTNRYSAPREVCWERADQERLLVLEREAQEAGHVVICVPQGLNLNRPFDMLVEKLLGRTDLMTA